MLRDTERLSFRRWTIEDASDMFLWTQEPDVTLKAGWPPHQKVDDALGYINHIIERDYLEDALIFKDIGKPIGCVRIKFGRCVAPVQRRPRTKRTSAAGWLNLTGVRA